MRPPHGVTTPEMHLNSVVLPAPFGPMIETKSPSATFTDTPSSAVSPP